MKQILLKDLMNVLNYIDVRAVRGWCNRNGVTILKQGKNEFVFESNFKEAFEKPFIENLKRKFEKDWEQVYRLYENNNIPALNALSGLTSVPAGIYKSKSEVIKQYQSKFQEYAKTKAA